MCKIHSSSKVKVKSLSHARLFATSWTVAYQAPPSMGFSKQEYWSGLLFPSPGDLPDPGIKPRSPALQADALQSEQPGKSLYIHLKEWYKKHLCILYPGLPWWSHGKESACNAGDPGLGRALGEGNEWQPTTVFLSGKFHEQRSLANFSPWGHKESDMTERLTCTCTLQPAWETQLRQGRKQTHGASAN